MRKQYDVYDLLLCVGQVEAQGELIRCHEIIKFVTKGKAAGATGVVTEMIMANENHHVEWLTDWCNLIMADDLQNNLLLPVYK